MSEIAAPAAAGEAQVVLDDAELLRRTGHGSQAAFRELVDRHARYLYGVAFALVGHADDAEDVVQETFAGALSSRFRGEASVRTWLVQILVRRAAMLRRSRRHRTQDVSLDAAHGDSHGMGHRPSPESGASAKLDLAAMLQTLSPDHRQVIVLRELEGLSYEEIAAALGVPRGTVESRLHRAREDLRKRFKDYL